MQELISQIEFDVNNPAAFEHSIFPDQLIKLTRHLDYDFATEFYSDYLVYCYNAEFIATIAYPLILKRIKEQQYEKYLHELTELDRQQVYQYFDQMIQDEQEHADYFFAILHKVNPALAHKITNTETLQANSLIHKHTVESTDLVQLLVTYYIGECYLWVSFYQIYKLTQDLDKKKIFKKLLVEEAQHNNNILKILKKIQPKISLTQEQFVSLANDSRLFGLAFTKNKFHLNAMNSIANQKIMQLIYNTSWHKQFNQIYLKKTYQLYQILYPESQFEQFQSAVNQHESAWLQ
jgi:rubrerythrin